MHYVTAFQSVLSDDPTLRLMQAGLLFLAMLIVFLLLFATRDILLRTRSFLYQLLCIVIVAILPGLGFLLYLLIRPARTIKEREMEGYMLRMVDALCLADDCADCGPGQGKKK